MIMLNFKPLTSDDYNLLKPYFANQTYQLSGYSLPSLVVWQDQQPFYAIADDTIIIYAVSEKRPEDTHLILPVSLDGEYSPQKLRNLVDETNIASFWFVSEDYFQRQKGNGMDNLFAFKEQPIFEDYVYLASDLAELKGNKFSKKRNLIHQFMKSHVNAGRVIKDSITPQNAEECLAFLEKWCKEYLCESAPDDDFMCEKLAVIKMIQGIDIFDVDSVVIRIDGAIHAFGICSRLNNETAVLNFEKADSAIKGLYQYLDRECAASIYMRYKYINKESDMGLPGLAHAKHSYHPVGRVKSYRLDIKK
jgi:hypothetical protein